MMTPDVTRVCTDDKDNKSDRNLHQNRKWFAFGKPGTIVINSQMWTEEVLDFFLPGATFHFAALDLEVIAVTSSQHHNHFQKCSIC